MIAHLLHHLSNLGATELKLGHIADALKTLEGIGIQKENPHLLHLWAAVSKLLGKSGENFNLAERATWRTVKFLIDDNQNPARPGDIFYIPGEFCAADINRYVPDRRFADTSIKTFPQLLNLVEHYSFNKFAADLAELFRCDGIPETIIGKTGAEVTHFYKLLVGLSATSGSQAPNNSLSGCAILWTPRGYVPPIRAKLPGNFSDPIGHFEIVDTSFFPDGMAEFVQNVLSVKRLSFKDYIEEHLEEVLQRNPSISQYKLLLSQILQHKNELETAGCFTLLSHASFVRTKAGTFAKPNDCYYWSAHLERVLGTSQQWWIDPNWLPAAPEHARMRDLLESHLGMPVRLSVKHAIERVISISKTASPKDAQEQLNPIFRELIDRWKRLSDSEHKQLLSLREIAFVPALVNEELDERNFYRPSDTFRAGRARAFYTQVPIINISPLRSASSEVTELLNLLKVPEEPHTREVVSHLSFCISNNIIPSELCYTILNERVEKEDGLEYIDELKGREFIYDSELGQFLAPDRVFWSVAPFGTYWRSAGSRMVQNSALFRRLGVKDSPEPEDYAKLILIISEDDVKTESDVFIYLKCLANIGEALDQGDADAEDAVELLVDQECFIARAGNTVGADVALWPDSEHLALPFGPELDDRVLLIPDASRSAIARLFRRLDVVALSEVASLELAKEPDRTLEPIATDNVQAIGDLLLWLAPNSQFRTQLRSRLSGVKIMLTERLQIRCQINQFSIPVSSPSFNAAAYYESETSRASFQ